MMGVQLSSNLKRDGNQQVHCTFRKDLDTFVPKDKGEKRRNKLSIISAQSIHVRNYTGPKVLQRLLNRNMSLV